MKDTDSYLLEEAYENIFYDRTLLQEKAIPVKRVDATTIEVDGERKEITDFLYQITDGGRQLITLWATRRRDKKEGGRIISRAGDEYVVNGRLGPCSRDVSGKGSVLGTPKQKYSNYRLISVCALRDKRYQTRNIGVDSVFKVKSGYNVYDFV